MPVYLAHRPVAGLLAAGLLVSGPAFATDTHPAAAADPINGLRVDIHGNLDAHGVFGAGARFEFPVVPDGLVKGTVVDELALSLGADFLFVPLYVGHDVYDGGLFLVPIAAFQWNFYVGDWSLFPELGVAMHVGFDHADWYSERGHVYPWLYVAPDIGIGARYHFNASTALLLRVSNPGGLQVGVAF